MKSILAFLLILSAVACGQRNAYTKDEIKQLSDEAEGKIPRLATKVQQSPIDSVKNDIEINVDDFLITIFNYRCISEPKLISDTIYLDTDTGQDLDYKLLRIIPKEVTDTFEISESFEQNLTLSLSERNWVTLPEWTFFDEYEALTDSSQYYRTEPFHRVEKAQELQTDLEKIKQKVLSFSGEYITPDLETVPKIQNLPVELWIDEVIIKIVRLKNDGTVQTWFIDAKSYYGC